MANKPFQKFIVKKESGAQKKERIRQDKKKIRLETKAYFDKKKAERRGGAINTDRQGTEEGRGNNEYRIDKAEIRSQKPVGRNKPMEIKIQKTITGLLNRNKDKSSIKEISKSLPQKEGPHKNRGIVSDKPIVKNTQASSPDTKKVSEIMPLNKFIAHAGVCSRRDAAEVVKAGKVFVNGQKILEPGFKVARLDEVTVNGKKITPQRNLVYILLNKPKDFITTTEDPQGRKTVMDIVKSATTERVYPIGRLDRNTTGVLLLTNDGELSQKLSHPSYEIRKIYEVTLDRQVTKKDFDAIANGVTLEDGFVQPDALAYPDIKNKHIIGIEIHSGRNRIVRRIFEHLGYDVRNLDRVMYANLTKKNVDRGKWRFLSEKEVRLLKFLNASYSKK
ncbi:MAG: pseudouridine synthase [Chitinophagaceae bacterium]